VKARRTFGEEIYRRRCEAGLNQAGVAQLAGVSPGYLSSIENNKVIPPPLPVCTRIAHVVGLAGPDLKAVLESVALEREALGVKLPRRTPGHLRDLIVLMVRNQQHITRSDAAGLRAELEAMGGRAMN
jgi:DNA-binding XRE family transcriptional regulator